MKAIHWITAAAALACTEPVLAGINDPEVIIYRFPGVTDAPTPRIATVFLCTNFSGATENIRYVTRFNNGDLATNKTVTIPHLVTLAAATRGTVAAYPISLNLAAEVLQGTTAIAATSTNIVCTAMTIDAGAPTPIGVALHAIRFSPVPGSQE
jgi:hypothetical protein